MSYKSMLDTLNQYMTDNNLLSNKGIDQITMLTFSNSRRIKNLIHCIFHVPIKDIMLSLSW